MKPISVFLEIAKFADLQWNTGDVSRTHYRICVTNFRESGEGGGAKGHPWAAPKKPILNRVNAKINEVKAKIPNITNFATTTTALTAIENKIPNVSNLAKKLSVTQKFVNLKIKKNADDYDHDKYITGE